MKRITHLPLGVVLALAGIPPAVSAGTLLISDNIVAASGRVEKHPANVVASLAVPVPLDRAEICVYYSNTTARRNKGRVSARATIQPQSGDPDTVLTFRGEVQSSESILCQQAPELQSGDVVTFDISFAKMPRLRHSETRTDLVKTSAVIEQDLMPDIFIPGPCPFTAPAPTPKPGTLLVSDVIVEAEQQTESHPGQLLASLVVPARLENAEICVDYRNTVANGNKGRIAARATIQPQSGDPETALTFEGNVQGNEAVLCQKAPVLQAGDVVLFDVSFAQMPMLRVLEAAADIARMSAVVAQDLVPPMVFTCPDSIPSNTISLADQAAASRLLNATLKTQLWRYTANRPTKWTVTGPKTQVVFGTPNGNVLPETTGYGDTIAAAVADYERKMGALQKGPALTAGDVRGLEWFSDLDSRPGPTSLRRDSNGPHFYGAYYRQSTGVVTSPPLTSIGEACEFLRASGL